jgi:hypothetical protein
METFNDFLNCEQLITFKKLNNNFDNLISINELKIIFDNMEKTDYTQTGRDRWLDLNYLLSKIINKKNTEISNNKKITLTNLCIDYVIETFPPRNVYNFSFS